MKKNIELSFLLALAVIIGLIESLIPFVNGMIPGLKLGLANAIIIFVIYIYGFKDGVKISILRVFLMGILRVGLFSVAFFLSFSGALISVVMMYLAKRFTSLSIVGVSIVGAIFHGIGQLLSASVILNSISLINYLPFIILFSIPSGIIVGLFSKEIVKYYKSIVRET